MEWDSECVMVQRGMTAPQDRGRLGGSCFIQSIWKILVMKSTIATVPAVDRESIRNERARREAGRVLLVDDSQDLLAVLKRALEVRGYSVVTAPNGTLAMKMAREQEFDVVVTDIIMPEKEGLETIMELKKVNPGIAVVAMSGGGRINAEEQLLLAKKLGAIGTLKKPFGLNQLLELLESQQQHAA